jgi:ribosomal protein S18 acetylase RimI-like enzyme
MSRITICECQGKDLDESLRRLWINLAREMFEIEPITIPPEANSNKWFNFVKDGLDKRRTLLLIAKAEEKTVGFVSATLPREQTLEVAESFSIINDLYVLPEFRRKGIGKKLLEECMNRIRAEGFKVVRLSVLPKDENAMRLYQKFGFTTFLYSMARRL